MRQATDTWAFPRRLWNNTSVLWQPYQILGNRPQRLLACLGCARLRRLRNVRDKPETARQGRRGPDSELMYLRYKRSFRTRGQATTVYTTGDPLPDPFRKPPTPIPLISKHCVPIAEDISSATDGAAAYVDDWRFRTYWEHFHMSIYLFFFFIWRFDYLTFFTFYHLTFIPFDFLNFDFLLLTFFFFDFLQFDFYLFDFLRFWLFSFDFLLFWLLGVLTFCHLTFCLLTFSLFDFPPFDFYLFDFLSFDFMSFDFLSFDFLSFDFLSWNLLILGKPSQ